MQVVPGGNVDFNAKNVYVKELNREFVAGDF